MRNSAVLRAELVARGVLEIDGYELAAPLAHAIDACDAAALALAPCSVHWFATGSPAPAMLAARAERLRQRWAERGVTLHFEALEGVPFWSGKFADCPSLLDATSAAFALPAP